MTRCERYAWAGAALGLVATIVGWILTPTTIPYAWLAAFTTFSLWPLGSLALLFAHALTGGRWGEAIRPGLLAGAALTPFLALLAIPVVLSLPTLYPWARPGGASLANSWWLNIPFYAVRGSVSLVVWIVLAFFAVGTSRETPIRTASAIRVAARTTDLARLAPFALLLLALTITTEAIDTTMSLDPHFTSSSYGMIAAASAGVTALAAAILASPATSPDLNDQLGRLLLGLTILWTYLDFMQLLIVYQNDLVTQTPWYRARAHGPAGSFMALISLLHSVIPFFTLLAPRVRRSRTGLCAAAALLLLAELLRNFWTVLPAAPHGTWPVDAACILFMGAATLAWTLRRTRRE